MNIKNHIFKVNPEGSDGSGLFDLDINVCRHPAHEPPMFIHIPQGKGYRHVCPSCKKVTNLIPPQITL